MKVMKVMEVDCVSLREKFFEILSAKPSAKNFHNLVTS